jgi:hypothetical protein
VRGTFHLGVIATLLVAFAQAPFIHVHDHDPAHEHAHGFTHAHWAGENADVLALEADDHSGDARSLSWIAGDGKSPVRLAAALPEAISIREPIAQPALVIDRIHHSHDPPWRSALNSRAPPA